MAAVLPLYVDSNNDMCQMLSGDFLAIAQGGTGATTQSGAVANLGLTIGTNTQAWSARLDALAALNSTGLMVQTGTNTFADVSIAVASTARLTVTNANGSGGNPTLDLATLTDGGTGTFLKITRDTYGRVSGTTAVVAGDISTLVDTRYAQLGGAAFTGTVTLAADPSTALGAATKQYVDNIAQGLQQKPTAWVATTAALPTNTYSNGASGVGATLTATSNGTLTIDGVLTTLGMVIFVKNEAAPANNGLYTVTTAGAAGAAYVLTRHVDMDQSTEFTGAFIIVDTAGTANGGSLWVCNNNGAVTVGTTSVTFTQLNKGTDLAAGNGISITANSVAVVTANSGRIVVSGSGVDLASGIVTPGTYTKLTVDTYGRVTTGATATAADVGAQASSTSLTNIAALGGNGIVAQTGANTFANRSIATASSARITVTNGDGAAGNPTVDLASGVIATPGTYNQVTVDTYGRVTGGTTVSSVAAVVQSSLTNNQGSTVVIGRAVYSDASGTFKLAQANASGTRLVTGLVLDTSVNNGAVAAIATDGVLTATTGQWDVVTGGTGGLTAGAKYFLSNGTAGAITSTAPTTGYLVYVGKALSTTQLQIEPAPVPIRLT